MQLVICKRSVIKIHKANLNRKISANVTNFNFPVFQSSCHLGARCFLFIASCTFFLAQFILFDTSCSMYLERCAAPRDDRSAIGTWTWSGRLIRLMANLLNDWGICWAISPIALNFNTAEVILRDSQSLKGDDSERCLGYTIAPN